MLNISIKLKSDNWGKTINEKGVEFNQNGQVFHNNIPLDRGPFSAKISSIKETKDLCNLLKSLNGFYAWIEHSPGSVRAAVDHIRSKPLFYTASNNNFYLSDDAEWVRRKARDEIKSPIAKEEFLLSGYVTGPDTLYPNVKQLQAGECLTVSDSNGSIKVETHRFYRFLHSEPIRYKEPLLREQLNQAAAISIKNLIKYANGRQIVLPLSGGYDSRILALLLKKFGYENILTFTYGVPGNSETKTSKMVADSLGMQWRFVEYTNTAMAKDWSSSDAKAYRELSSNHCSLPHVQDYFAVKKLIENEQIARDAVVVPGHTGDFISGGHIPPIVFSGKQFQNKDLINTIIGIHYANKPNRSLKAFDKASLSKRIKNRINIPFDGTAICFANSVEVWNWQERQAKYIVNSVRVYDHFKLDWWLPMWDAEFIRFWENVPLSLRESRKWFIDWVDGQCREEGIKTFSLNEVKTASNLNKLKKLLKPFFEQLPVPLTNKLSKAMRWAECRFLNKGFEGHFLAFEGLIPKSKLDKYFILGYNILGVYSDLFLKGKWEKIEGWK